MPQRSSRAALLALGLDPKAPLPLQRQLYDQLREAVLAGRLAPGTRLPASRGLSRELGCSRNTVLAAVEQLVAEGYLEGRVGSGTYVSGVLPEELLAAKARDAAVPRPPAQSRGLSARGRVLAGVLQARPPRHKAFVAGLADLDAFPFDLWGRALARTWRHPPRALLSHGDAAGYLPLRRAIVTYLKAVRAVDCAPEQVVVTSGAQQAVDLAARALLEPGDEVWLEEPGYPGLRGPLVANGARLAPVPVDAEGLSLEAGRRLAPAARLAMVTPSHQYPLGTTMTLARRLALLDWARAGGAWILEDDFDSEYRYAGRPLAALQGLDAAEGPGCVLYLGSFSKVLFPSLRLGYLVVPPGLVEAFLRVRGAVDDHPSSTAQPALAAFIEEGHFAAHVRRMRGLYAARQAALVAAIRRRLDGLLAVDPDPAGMHLVAGLAPELAARRSDAEIESRAAAAGITAFALSSFYLGPPARQGLLLGYAALTEREIEAGVERLAAVLEA